MTVAFQAAPQRIPKLGLIFLGRKRPGFDPVWGDAVRKQTMDLLEREHFALFLPTEKPVDDATLRVAVAECRLEKCDALLVLQPTMSDGRLASVLAQTWGDALVLMATPENPVGEMISSCSLVGTHAFAAALRQLGKSFELVYGGSDWAECGRQLRRAVPLAMMADALKSAKIGLVGYHAPGFVDMHPDPFLLSKTYGVQMQHVGLVEFMDAVQSQPDAEVKRDCDVVASLGIPLKDVQSADLPMQSRFYLALRKLIAAESFSALSLRCWPEIPNVVGHWPYLALARLASEGFPIACEGDVDGALCCLVAERLNLGAVYLSDWLEHSRDTITAWHGGMAPFQLCDPIGKTTGPRLAKHFNSLKPMVVDSTLRSGMSVTAFRLWNCDNQYRMMIIEGETIDPKRQLLGTNGVIKVEGANLYRFFDQLCHQGMPHHIAVVEGHQRDVLQAFARHYGISLSEECR